MWVDGTAGGVGFVGQIGKQLHFGPKRKVEVGTGMHAPPLRTGQVLDKQDVSAERKIFRRARLRAVLLDLSVALSVAM